MVVFPPLACVVVLRLLGFIYGVTKTRNHVEQKQCRLSKTTVRGGVKHHRGLSHLVVLPVFIVVLMVVLRVAVD